MFSAVFEEMGDGGKVNCIFRNPNEAVEVRIKDLLSRMTLREKVGQMTQIERRVADPVAIRDFFIGINLSLSHSLCCLNVDWGWMGQF